MCQAAVYLTPLLEIECISRQRMGTKADSTAKMDPRVGCTPIRGGITIKSQVVTSTAPINTGFFILYIAQWNKLNRTQSPVQAEFLWQLLHNRDPRHTYYQSSYRMDGVVLFYREAGPKDVPVVLLLHGKCPLYRRLYRRTDLGLRISKCSPCLDGLILSSITVPV